MVLLFIRKRVPELSGVVNRSLLTVILSGRSELGEAVEIYALILSAL